MAALRRRRHVLAVIKAFVVTTACSEAARYVGNDAASADVPVIDAVAADQVPAMPSYPPPQPGCAEIYRQDVLPTFEIEIRPEDWAALWDEYVTYRDLGQGDAAPKTYRPLVAFRHGAATIGDAEIRLKGGRSWQGDKMQFQISF